MRTISSLRASLACLFLTAGLLAQQPVQILGIPSETTVDLSSGVGVATAYCLEEHVKGVPDDGEPLTTGVGSIELTLVGGELIAPVDLQTALDKGYLTTEGTDTALHVRLRAGQYRERDEEEGTPVQSVRFLEGSAVFQKEIDLSLFNRAALGVEVRRALDGIDAEPTSHNGSVWPDQRRLWSRGFGVLETVVEVEGRQTLTIKGLHFDPNSHLEMVFPALQHHGDSSLLRTPGGRYVLHDAGATESEMDALLAHVQPSDDGVRRVSIIITHPDYDHYRGLERFLQAVNSDEGWDVDEVFVGVDPNTLEYERDIEATQYRERFRRVLHLLRGDEEQDDGTWKAASEPLWSLLQDFDGYARFIGPSKDGLSIAGNDLRAVPSLRYGDHLVEADKPRVWRFVTGEDGIEVQFVVPSTSLASKISRSNQERHARNIITRYSHFGFSLLDLGDASAQQLGELIVSDHGLAEKAAKVARRAGDDQFVAVAEAHTRRVSKGLGGRRFPSSGRYKPVSRDLEAFTVKWPHHASVPLVDESQSLSHRSRMRRERETMKAFLRGFRPKQILVNAEAGVPEERLKALRELVEEAERDAAEAGEALSIRVQVTKGFDYIRYLGQVLYENRVPSLLVFELDRLLELDRQVEYRRSLSCG